MTARFKSCPCCGELWSSREAFLEDPQLDLCGYFAVVEEVEKGSLLFTHTQAGCNTTLTVSVKPFLDLYNGPQFSTILARRPGCPHLCLDRNELTPCSAECACAYVREVLQIIRNWPKSQ